ncbi:hypothetical protein [Rhizorhabdus dicambivorans]|uniref:Uncharacterized protein n=1 Tax=Rhizorhabdus dicambivorans TaxID=1850238 RepID=A0A2A4G335_9SPHN|nr:hypothetical protein [Rhizorhabdus dicambivorans]ATE67307.1 hypothetical protein CMV14_12515 [Rhizorhabdus dicambivorans]PCE44446.1 hypothetical protein COO09_01900 [Rhizorhabdus dicambivorans]
MKAAARSKEKQLPGASPYLLALREELADRSMKRLAIFALGDLAVEVAQGADSVWALIRRPGLGGFALRAAYAPGLTARRKPASDAVLIEVKSPLGRHEIWFATSVTDLHRLRMTVRLTPAVPLLIPFLPRDLYPLDVHDDPTGARGQVEAAQRGVNTGLLFLRRDEPGMGSLLYFQNLTAMNGYYRATDTVPDGVVGGEWPEFGYLPPSPPQSGTPPTKPLPPGETLTISDAILVFRDMPARDEQDMARLFLQLLGSAYAAIDRPDVEYRDWTDRADRTLQDLINSPKATVRHYGHLYVHPYTDSEYPDAMVQLSLIAALHDYAKWRGKPVALERSLLQGLPKFYDAKLGCLRRYLPNVGEDKDADAVDSWYLYHPLLNLARLALDGVEEAKALLFDSLEYAIRAAHHFHYRWPIQFKVGDFSIITATAADDHGQTDVGGIYAYVMLLCFQLTDDKRFLDEARAAIEAARGMRFTLNYQANLTAWGAAACLRLWRITDEPDYLQQGYVYLASFFHNTEIWESEIGAARHYHNFLGATCLQDAPYMAIYECFESFAAFERLLDDGGPRLEPAVRALVSEYCRYALDRAWFYYPDTLPRKILATKIRNGHIDPKLSFPLEDIYADGQAAGQVGQEIYGAGAAFVFATRSEHWVTDAPFRLFCNQFLRGIERTGEHALAIQLDGAEGYGADLSVIRLPRRRMPRLTLCTADGDPIKPRRRRPDRVDYRVPAEGRLVLQWLPATGKARGDS